MSFITKNLLANEQLLYRARLHWVIFLPPLFYTVLAVVCLLQRFEIAILGLILLAVAVLTWLSVLIKYYSSEYGLTNMRLLIKTGFIRRHSIEMLLQRVESIQVVQSFLGRLLGYGTIIVCGIGGNRDPFHQIADPLSFRRQVQEQLEKILTSKA